ncbi:MAG: hypothetical protein AABZ80_03005 [Gemmatimonadota bacterium]
MNSATTRRAVLLGLALTATACDLVQFASDPKPRFEETWNLPGPDTRMSVANLLPSGGTVTILPDSSAFSLKIDSTTISRVVGSDCAQCVTLNGTNAPKPAFTLVAGNSTALPADIVSAAIASGTLSIRLVNNMSFDPLYVNTAPAATVQGYMVIVVRSGSAVLARDSVRGAATVSGTQNAPFPKLGGILNRTIPLSTGTVTTNLTVDVTVNSPLGDHLEFINANGALDATASVPTINVASVQMNVPSRTFDSGGADSVSMPSTGDFVVGLGLDMTITNPFASVTGGLNLVFAWGPGATQQISKPITLPSGTGVRSVSLDSTEVQNLLNGGDKVSIKLTGNVSSATPVTVTPKQEVKVSNRMRLKIRTPSGGGK